MISQEKAVSRSTVILAGAQFILGSLAAGVTTYVFTNSTTQAILIGLTLGLTVAITSIVAEWAGISKQS